MAANQTISSQQLAASVALVAARFPEAVVRAGDALYLHFHHNDFMSAAVATVDLRDGSVTMANRAAVWERTYPQLEAAEARPGATPAPWRPDLGTGG